MPDKINVFELIEREEKEIITVIPTAITPPKKEANGKIEICIRIMGPISIKTIVAPNADPEAAPIRYGSARGFLNIDWNVAPDNAIEKPTIPASSIRGNLSWLIITVRLSEISAW